MLTKGTLKEMGGKFTTTPVTLFVYEAGQAVSGRGVQLAFQVNFTFTLAPSIAVEFNTLRDKQQGDMRLQHVGLNIQGQARSVAAVKAPFSFNNKKPYTARVDYDPRDPGTIHVFLAATEVKPELPLLERRLALCEVLQAGAEQQKFFFGLWQPL
ncbi:unnamed protein product [Closterium sp. Naga37s-1]|nr:unnamed protein product [Closterium sp. Naga37s-1]